MLRQVREKPMRVSRRDLVALSAAFVVPAVAQPGSPPGPESAVTLVVPFSAGGSADMAARALATHLPAHLPGQPRIVVENRPGASGAVGTLSVARAAPDGRTLLLARVGSSAILPATDRRTAFAWDDFTFLGLLDQNAYAIAVRADAPWADLAALVTALRDQPGQLRFATSGPATILDLGVRQMFIAAGLELDAATAVVLRGGGEAVQALLDGQAQFIGNNMPDLVPRLRDGSLRALAVSGDARLAEFPAVPSMSEAGFPALEELTGWSALAGPPGMAPELVARWAEGLVGLGRDHAWLAELRRQSSHPRLLPPEEARAYIGAQVALYRELARRLGLS
jgi:tripartite-type tricarboxylate transporter receptor subunit TctC